VNGKAVWDEVLKSRREAEGPDWRPSFMEGVGYQIGVRNNLWQQFTSAEQSNEMVTSDPQTFDCLLAFPEVRVE
jgi:hypothetical protein